MEEGRRRRRWETVEMKGGGEMRTAKFSECSGVVEHSGFSPKHLPVQSKSM